MSLDLGVRITWLGHSTFLLTGPGGERVLVEAFVGSNPSCPAALRRLDRVDVIALTHGHADHVGDVLEIQPVLGAPVVAMVEVAAWLRSKGIGADDVVEMNKGGTVSVAGIQITMTDANHSAGIFDGDRVLYGGEPAGLVFTFGNGTRIYHAGDTNVFGDMALIGELYQPDVAMIPIGDHYTMGPREAAKACELLGVGRVIPMHYGTFPVLTGTPDELRVACGDRGLQVEIIALEPGQTIE